MAEIVISVAAKVAEYLVGPVVRPFRYFWDYKSNVENVENEVRKLEGRRETVKQLVVEASREGDEIFEHVQDWLDDANKIIDEVLVVIEDNKQANTKCCKGLCPNPKKQFQLSKEAVRKVEAVARVHATGKFDRVSYRTIPEETWLPSVKGFEAFDSRMPTLKSVLQALTDPDVNMVGVYGMGGIGKTTLAKEVAGQTEDKKLFDVIIFVEVSETPEIRKIQAEIADKLGLVFSEESDSGRARRLCDRLKKEKKVLLILDNIWGTLDLESVGIPSTDDHRGCKLLLTARNRDTLTNKMDCQNNFAVDILNEEEAWNLFKKTTGACVEQLDLQVVANDIAKACGGMPLAIVATAKALRDTKVFEWNNALRELRRPSSGNFEGVAAQAHLSIQLSYDHLENEELKSIFLLCATMERTYNASIRDLLRHGMGLGVFRRKHTMEAARDRLYTLLQKLKDASLLLDTPDNECFSMHDVIRDIARSIALRIQYGFVVTDNAISQDWTDEETLKNFIVVSMHDITKLPEELECLQLQFLYMNNNDQSLLNLWKGHTKIPDNFFTKMPQLRDLHIKRMNLSLFPTSFCHLKTLQTLCLEKCILRDVAIVGDFKKLEILSFSGSSIVQLPKEIGQLTRLRVLDLSNCSYLRVIPPNVISRLTHLEELYMDVTFIEWEDEGSKPQRSNASLEEFELLSHLTALEIHIKDAKILPQRLFFKQLERYKIIIGARDGWNHRYSKISRSLKLKLDSGTGIEGGVIRQLKGIKELCLGEVKGVRNALYDLDKEGFPELQHLEVEESPCFLSIVEPMESASCDVFPVLESLHLYRLVNLEKIYNGLLRGKSFCQLKTIVVGKCDKLKNIFSFSIASGLPQLHEVTVRACENIEEIFVVVSEEDANTSSEVNDNVQFSCQLHTLSLSYLPNLRTFCSKVKTSSSLQRRQKLRTTDTSFEEIILEDEIDIPTPLFNEQVMFRNLEVLELIEINVEKIWPDQFPTMSYVFQNLTRLTLQNCWNLKYLLSSSIANSFMQLEYLHILHSNVMEELVAVEEMKEEERKYVIFPRLNYLWIEQLPNLRRFNSGTYIEFPSLKELTIERCSNFKGFIFDDKVGLPSLEKLKIMEMYHLKRIWHDQLAKDSFCKLKSVDVLRCDELVTLLPLDICRRSLGLDSVSVSACGCVENIFDFQKLNFEDIHPSAANQLRHLKLELLPKLEHIWNKDYCKEMISFPELDDMTVTFCYSLKSLFPASIAKNLLRLRQLYVQDCGVEEIVVEGVEEEAARFVFPSLTSLKLYKLRELRTFYPRLHSTEWPVLRELTLDGCDKVKLFASELLRLHETSYNIQLTSSTERPLFLVEKEKAFPNLEELKLSGKDLSMIWHGQIPEWLFPKLKTIRLHCLGASALALLKTFHNVERLVPIHGSYNEIYSYEEVEKHEGMLPQIKHLSLSSLRDLKHMWEEDSRLVPVLENLETLHLSECHSLINLVPPSATFRNLTILDMFFCHNLINLVSSSTARSLVQLREMRVYGAGIMTEIVASDGDASEADVIFSKLKSLKLECLFSLTSFCYGKYALKFPSLEELLVSYCPKLLTLFDGDLITPRSSNMGKTMYQEGDLNTALQQLHQKNPHSSAIGDNESSIEDHSIPKALLSSTVFLSLTILSVSNSDSLINLMTSSTAKSLADQLTGMSLSRCKMMTEVVVNEKDTIEDDITFSKLESLSLYFLASLTSFCSGNRTLKFPILKELSIKYCPKMKIFSGGYVNTPNLRRFSGKVYQEDDLNTAIQQLHQEVSINN